MPARCCLHPGWYFEYRVDSHGLHCPAQQGVMEGIISERSYVDGLPLSKTVESNRGLARIILALVRRNNLRCGWPEDIEPQARLCNEGFPARQCQFKRYRCVSRLHIIVLHLHATNLCQQAWQVPVYHCI